MTRNRTFIVLSLVLLAISLFWTFKLRTTPSETVARKEKRFRISEIAALSKKSGKSQEKAHAPESAATTTKAELHAILAAGDTCALLNFTLVEEFNLMPAVMEIVQAPDIIVVNGEADRMLEELFGTAGALNKSAIDRPGTSSAIITEFYNALLFADLISGLKSNHVDLAVAREILLNLRKLDPENGAHPFMLAAVRSKQGAPPEELKALLFEAFEKPRFDTFINTISRRIREKSFANSAYFVLSISVIAYLPIPDILTSQNLIKEFTSQDKDFAKASLKFASLLLNQKIPEDGRHEMTLWNALDYAVGQLILKRSWKQLHPDKKLPPFKEFKSLINHKNRITKLLEDAGVALGVPKTAQKCNSAPLDEALNVEKEDFQKALAEM